MDNFYSNLASPCDLSRKSRRRAKIRKILEIIFLDETLLEKISSRFILTNCSIAFPGFLVRLLTKTIESRNLELTEYNVPNAQSRGFERRAVIRSIIFSLPFLCPGVRIIIKTCCHILTISSFT